MRFTRPPVPIPRARYDEAAHAYARRVGRRAVAIYQVGVFSHAGLSDLDLLVVPRRARIDNAAFFAVRNQLPPLLRVPFRYDPDVVPLGEIDVLRFTTHRHRKLIWGEDVAAHVECLETPEQRWSMVFERLWQFAGMRRRGQRRGRVDLWKLIARTKSVGISLADLDALTGSRHADAYLDEVEALRSRYFELDPQVAGRAFWSLFDYGLTCIEQTIGDVLPLDDEAPSEFGRRFLTGHASVRGLSEAALEERRRAVLRAQRATRALGFGENDVITAAPYASRGLVGHRAPASAAWQRVAVGAVSAAYTLRNLGLRFDTRGARRQSP